MADKHTGSGPERIKQFIEKIDEQEGGPPPSRPVNGAPAASRPLATEGGSSETAGLGAGRLWETFRSVAIIFSFVVNVILVAVVAVIGLYLFEIKNSVAEPLLAGLYNGFAEMDTAHLRMTVPINTTIPVNDKVKAKFDLHIAKNTTVTLTQPTPIPNTTIFLNGQAIPVSIILPAGTPLNVNLDFTVPVDQDIPVVLNIPISIPVSVDIPLSQTDLHKPFTDLRHLFQPYNEWMLVLPDSWGELFAGRK